MIYLTRLVLSLMFLGASLQISAQNASDVGVRTHQDNFARPVYHGSSFAIAGATYNKVGKQIQHTWWINWGLRSDQRKSKSFSGRKVTVKIRQQTPYNTWFTAASKTCSP